MNPDDEVIGAPVRKAWEIKAADATLEENVIKGTPSVMGLMDRGRDVCAPGMFKKSLKAFLQHGFVAVGHKWSELPIAMPIKAQERGNVLYSEAVFHSTEAAQECRTVCQERLARGLSVGLSVGFSLDYETGRMWFDDGKTMAKWIEDNRGDADLFDLKSIRQCKSYCRLILEAQELFEYSIASVPMNPAALATEAKGFGIDIDTIVTERDFEAFLRDAGYSRKDATALTLHGFKALPQRDADAPEPESADTEAKILQLQSDYLKAIADYEALAGASL